MENVNVPLDVKNIHVNVRIIVPANVIVNHAIVSSDRFEQIFSHFLFTDEGVGCGSNCTCKDCKCSGCDSE